MTCPNCNSDNHYVTKTYDNGSTIKRRRACKDCGYRWNTQEWAYFKKEKRNDYTGD